MFRVVCTLLCTLVLTGSPLAGAEVLKIAVASNFSAVLEQLGTDFTANSGHQLSISTGSTGVHFAQISNGAPFDVFVAADIEHPRLLVDQGLAVAGSLQVYAGGNLLLWSTDPDLVDTAGKVLETGNFRHLALANPAQAPYGLAARQVLEHLGLWQSLQPRLVQGENITQAYQFVHSGNAELGFIASSQWQAGHPTGSVWLIPQALYSPIDQAAVIIRDSQAARAFMAYLQSDWARNAIAAAGYRIP